MNNTLVLVLKEPTILVPNIYFHVLLIDVTVF